MEKGTLFQGPLRINAKNRQQAFVTIEGLDIDVYLMSEMAKTGVELRFGCPIAE